jgi:hypothetical protein
MATYLDEIKALESRDDTVKGTFTLDGFKVSFTVAHDDYCVTTRQQVHSKACVIVEAMSAALDKLQEEGS